MRTEAVLGNSFFFLNHLEFQIHALTDEKKKSAVEDRYKCQALNIYI